jgi:hypothetical protein
MVSFTLSLLSLLWVAALRSSTATAKYVLKDTYLTPDTDDPSTFFDKFDFFTGPDPTQGFVKYVSRSDAADQGLIARTRDNRVYMGVDDKHKTTTGRASVRIESKATYNQGLLIADISHMPASVCGSWPAFWLLGPKWPNGGEIDILEGVNEDDRNRVTLHTGPGCVVEGMTSAPQKGGSLAARARFEERKKKASQGFVGEMITENCDVKAPNQEPNQGCTIRSPEADALQTYGTGFNEAGGGVYATEIRDDGVSVWFFPYDTSKSSSATDSPSRKDVLGDNPDPSTWGKPLARFEGAGCNFKRSFRDMKIIFDTTFCGEWAGRVWEEEGCAKSTGAKTCAEYVGQNPKAFEQSWWGVAELRWFEEE